MLNGFFDLQVNGYAGVDFNQNDLKLDDLHSACSKLKEDNVAGILATIITDDLDRMKARLQRLVQLRDQDELIQEIIYGLHIEGPFINPKVGFRGAHSEDKIMPAQVEIMKQLLDAAQGLTRIVTLAPEVDDGYKVISMLAKTGITVSAGHSDASIDELQAAINEGLTMFTHLGNGCPMIMPRHDNIIQRALYLADKLWLCFIADGIHIVFPALHNYMRLAGYDKCIVVTDAMAGAGAVPGKYKIGDQELVVGQDRIVRKPGGTSLAGSAIDMRQCRHNLKHQLDLNEQQINQLTFTNPKKAINFLA